MGLLRITDIATLETVFDQVGDGLVACDVQGHFLVWNRGAEQILGTAPHDIEPSAWAATYGLHCPNRLCLLELNELPMWRALESMEPIEQTIWLVNPGHPNGAWLDVRARPWISPSGELLGVIATFRDITYSRWAVLTCRLMGALFLSEDYAIVGFDEMGTIVSWNPGAQKLWGYSPAQALGQSTFILMPPARIAELAILSHLLAKNLPVPRVESQIMRADGVYVPVTRSVTPWRDEFDGFAGGVVVVQDISPRKQVEKKLRERRQQLRELSARLEQVKEEELLRISRELHDELGQQLTGLRLDLAWLESRIGDSKPELNERMEMMAELLDDTLRQVRRLSAQMRPPLLDELGLPSAITHWAEQLGERTSLVVKVELNANLSEVLPDSSLAIYRILQEASTNVLRHAEARHFWLTAHSEEDHLIILIRDDGRGFVPPAGPPKRGSGLGLLGMQERAHLWGGEVAMESALNQGTTVRIRLPWGQIRRPLEQA